MKTYKTLGEQFEKQNAYMRVLFFKKPTFFANPKKNTLSNVSSKYTRKFLVFFAEVKLNFYISVVHCLIL